MFKKGDVVKVTVAGSAFSGRVGIISRGSYQSTDGQMAVWLDLGSDADGKDLDACYFWEHEVSHFTLTDHHNWSKPEDQSHD